MVEFFFKKKHSCSKFQLGLPQFHLSTHSTASVYPAGPSCNRLQPAQQCLCSCVCVLCVCVRERSEMRAGGLTGRIDQEVVFTESPWNAASLHRKREGPALHCQTSLSPRVPPPLEPKKKKRKISRLRLVVVVLLVVVVVVAFSFDGLPPLTSLVCPPRPSLPSPTIVVTISLFIRLLRSSSSGVRAPFLLLLQVRRALFLILVVCALGFCCVFLSDFIIWGCTVDMIFVSGFGLVGAV